MSDRPREPLLLFSHHVEMDACLDALRRLTTEHFKAERVGIGPRDARTRTAYLLESQPKPSIVLSLGSAGWLAPERIPHMAVWAREVRLPDGTSLMSSGLVPANVLERIGVYRVRLLSVARPITDADRAGELHKETGAHAVDMESGAIFKACIEHRVESAALRAVTDRATKTAAGDYRRTVEGAMNRLAKAVAPLLAWLWEHERERLERRRVEK